jgi:hypothetical protein
MRLPEEVIRVMKKLLGIVWIFGMLASCTAGKDYQRPVGSWLNFDIITTGKDYQRVLDSWLGYDIEALVKRWGYPTNVSEMANGNTIYAFNRLDERQSVLVKNAVPPIASRICAGSTSLCLDSIQRLNRFLPDSMQATSFRSKTGSTYLSEYISLAYDNEAGDQILEFLCETIFEVGIDNSIENWSYRGDDCY